MKIKTNIAFDIDGVIVDFTNTFLLVAKDKFGILKNAKFSDVTRYQFHECLDISSEKCFEIVDYILVNPFECNVKPIKGAVATLTSLSNDNDLVFITARKDEFKQQTKKLVYNILPDVDKDKITIIHQRGSTKYQVLNNLNINHFVDDRSRNVRILNYKGIKAFLFNSPWNEQTRDTDSFMRISNWKEIKNLIKDI